jgi:hypothetical protein
MWLLLLTSILLLRTSSSAPAPPATAANRSGPFGPPASFTQVIVAPGQGSWGNDLGDLNRDGHLDIVEGGGDLGSAVYWFEYPAWRRYQIGSEGGGDDLQVGDVNHDGALDVVVNGGPLIWYENPMGKGGDPHLRWTPHVVDGIVAHDLVLADLNGDGKLDVIVRVEKGPTYIYLQGVTADSWTKVLVPQAPPAHGGLAVADIDRDARPDLVENGFWLQQPNDPVHSTWVRHDFIAWPAGASVGVADFNHDGRMDIILAVSETGRGAMAWFEAPPDPIRGVWIQHDIDTVEDVHRFHVVDVNKDGNPDIVFAEMHQSATKRVGVYYNGGGGLFWNLQVLSKEGSHNIAVGDIDNDGDIDIVGANWSLSSPDGGAMNLWRNDLNNALSLDGWTYIQADGWVPPDVTFGLAFADLDGDGWTDIVAGRYWYRNPGGDLTGTWARTDFGPGIDAMLVTDVDGDGRPDLIAQVESYPIINILWLRPADRAFTSWKATVVGSLPDVSRDTDSQGYRVAQLNAGGKKQVIFSTDAGHFYFTIPSTNPGAGNWPRVQIDKDGTQEGVDVADIGQDGKLDIVGFSHTSPKVSGNEVDWWENPEDGSGNWLKHVVGTTTFECDRIRVADINQDGRPDIVVTDTTNTGAGNLYWFEARPDGAWLKHNISGPIGALNSMDVGDINQDGKIDIAVGEHAGLMRTLIYENLGGGVSWKLHVVDSGKDTHLGAQLVDLDGDLDLDIVSTVWQSAPFLRIWRNDEHSVVKMPATH